MFWRDFNSNNLRSWPRSSVWREWDRLQREMNRLIGSSRRAAGGFPAVNAWTGPESAMITTEVPGIEPDDLVISVVGETLTLSGVREGVQLGEGERYHRRERGRGEFTRTLQLPYRIDAEKVEASFRNGVLSITVPRIEEDQPRKITVQSR